MRKNKLYTIQYPIMSKVAIVLIAITFIFLLGCQSSSNQISKLREGPSLNKLREKLRVPIIDSYMVKTDIHSFGSDRWESKEEIPTEGMAYTFLKIFYHTTQVNFIWKNGMVLL